MPAPRRLSLSPEQRTALVHASRTDARPYYRERCGALVQIADGVSIRHVARQGLLVVRDPHTVAQWVDRNEADGLDGLVQHERTARGYPP